MAIQWGAYEVSGGTGMRVGIQIESVSAVSSGSTTFVVSFTCWTQNQGSYSDNQTADLTSNKSLSSSQISYNNGQGSTITQRGGTLTATHTYSTYGTSPGNTTISVTINGTFNGVTPDATVNVAIPARPWANPAATTSASASRVSDTQASVSWTNNDSASAAYANIKLYRKTDSASYALISTLGVVTSYNDTGIAANHKYRFRPNVLGGNGSEVTGDESGDIWTTPGAPSGLVATKLGNGNIRLDWTNNVNYSEYTVRIEESQNGGAYSELTSVSGGVATYEHASPSTVVTHTYRVRARSNTGTLNSSYSAASNTIVLLATANPPTNLVPSGVARDAAEAIVFSWQHNPADGTPQSKYQLQYKVGAGAYTTVGPTTSSVSSFSLAAATLANGNSITWRVATAAQNGTVGAYSAESTFTTSARPTAAISSPTASHNSSVLTVAWTYFQAQSSAQASWQASVYNAAAVLLEQISGTSQTEGTFTTALADGATYTVTVAVTSGAGLASATPADSQAFTVTFLPPAAVAIDAAYDTGSGSMVLTVTGDDPSVGVTEAIDTVTIQRSIDGGAWVSIVEGLVLAGDPLTAIVLDTAPTISGSNVYRAVAYSALPSSAMSAEEEAITASVWAFLSAGDGFQTVVRLTWEAQYDQATDRAGALHHFAGREKPMALDGEALSGSIGVSAVLYGDSSTEADLHALARVPGPKLYRDPFGRRIFARVSGMKTSRKNVRTCNVTFTVSEVDYTE